MLARAGILSGLALLAAGCGFSAGNFAGKSCETNNECPEPYACAQVRPGARTCELVHGIEFGTGVQVVPPDYCHDAKPLLDKYCVSNCHGTDNSGSNGLPFRFDVYSLGGGVFCAFEKAANIKNRVAEKSMPPAGSPAPTDMEAAVLVRWANTGAAQCFDAGTP
jgi:hypothetical protein